MLEPSSSAPSLRPEAKRPARRLRELLARPGIVASLGAYDTLSALLIERAGLETVFLGGFGATASLLGLPDLDFLGAAEMAAAVHRVAQRVAIPVIADGDTGHGDIHHVRRCVREIEAAGAAGIILEDQVFPKRCGHFDGKRVIPASEMVRKLAAALSSRRDEDFVVVARTDAAACEGIDAAIERVNLYCATGADVAFVEAPASKRDVEHVARRVPYAKLANMLSFGKTPLYAADELERLGFKLAVAPIETLLVAARAVDRLARVFRAGGDARPHQAEMTTLDEMKQLLGLGAQLLDPGGAE